jgi:RNA polymerase sigma factor (TIGR02999 family)
VSDIAPPGEVTRLIQAARASDRAATDQLLALVYDQLRSIAQQRISEEPAGQTLQATALVHEAYLRLVGSHGGQNGQWENVGHFFSAAAEAMRRILIDRARSRGALKRGRHPHRLRLDQDPLLDDDSTAELLDLDDALLKLAAQDATKADLVKLRFFAGLTLEEAASTLGISPATADRHWSYARAWLYREMSRE